MPRKNTEQQRIYAAKFRNIVDKIQKIGNEIIPNFDSYEGYGQSRYRIIHTKGEDASTFLKRMLSLKKIRDDDRLQNLENMYKAYETKQKKKTEIKDKLMNIYKKNILKPKVYNEEKQKIIREAKENYIDENEIDNFEIEYEPEITTEMKSILLRQSKKDIDKLFNGSVDDIDLTGFNPEIKKMYLKQILNHEAEEGKIVAVEFDDGTSLLLSSYDNQRGKRSRSNFNNLINGTMKNDFGKIQYSTDTGDYNKDPSNVMKIKILSNEEKNNAIDFFTAFGEYKNRGGSFMCYKIKSVEQIIKDFKESKNPQIKFIKNESTEEEYNKRDEEYKNDDYETYVIKKLLKRYQLSNDLTNEIFKLNCLNYSILQAQKYNKDITDDLIYKIKSSNIMRHIDSKFIIKIAEAYNIRFEIYMYESEREDVVYNPNGKIIINLACFKNHFFVDDRSKKTIGIKELMMSSEYMSSSYFVSKVITSERFTYQELLNMPSCLEYADQIDLNREEGFYDNMIKFYGDEEKENIIRDIKKYIKEKYFKKDKDVVIDINTFKQIDIINQIMTVNKVENVEKIEDIDIKILNVIKKYTFEELTEKQQNQLTKHKDTKKKPLIVYADTEATVCESYEQLKNDRKLFETLKDVYETEKRMKEVKDNYKPFEQKAYCISFCLENNYESMKTYYGFDCLTKFMDDMAKLAEDNKVYVYFHNLGYDFNMFNQFKYVKCISKGRKIYSGSIEYKKQTIHFKDSLAILSMSIKKCALEFCGNKLEKEMFPYKYYNTQNVIKNEGTFKDIDIDEEYDFKMSKFKENCDKIGARIDNEHFDMIKYCQFYCERDVQILAKSFDTFRNDLLKEQNKDIINYTTIPALAKDLIAEAVLNYKNISLVAGELQEFLRKAIYGGRTMTSQNLPWLYKGLIASCDYCSLYPSAMSDLYTIKGKPEIMTKDECENNNYLNLTCGFYEQPTIEKYISGYVVEIVITKINKFKKFPRLTFKTDKGCQYLDRDVKLPRKVWVNNITLEDYIKAHDIEFYTIQGVKYTGLKDRTSIKDFIEKLFNKRAELKKAGKSSQIIYKLLLNSAYGKLIQKPIESEIKFVPTYERYKSKQLTRIFCKVRKIKTYTIKDWLNEEENKGYIKYFNKGMTNFKKNLTKEDLIYLLGDDYENIKKKDYLKEFKNIHQIEETNQIEEYLAKHPKLMKYFNEDLTINDKLNDETLKELFGDISIYYNYKNRYICKNEYKIKEITEITSDLSRVDVYKPQLDQFSDPFLGGLILSYSKRLMNNVFEIIEELEERDKDKLRLEGQNEEHENNVIAFYQDTDSIYLRYEYLDEINQIFKERYGHELLKSNTLLRMHSPDFEGGEMNLETAVDKSKFDETNILAVDSIFITKKLYYCKLQEAKSKAIGDHIRSKGIPVNALLNKVNTTYKGEVYKLYEDLYNGKTILVDLLITCANIKQNKSFKITSLNEFKRSMKMEKIDYSQLKYEDEETPKEPIDSLKVISLTDNDLMGPCWFNGDESFVDNKYDEDLKFQMLYGYSKFQPYTIDKHEIVNKTIIDKLYSWTEYLQLKKSNQFEFDRVYFVYKNEKPNENIIGKTFGSCLVNDEDYYNILEKLYVYLPFRNMCTMITGRARQLKYDNKIVIDFDVPNPEDRNKLIDTFKEFKVGTLILSPNNGLHIELEHDKLFYNDYQTGRFLKSYKNEWFTIDSLFPNCKWSIAVYEGAKILKKDGKTIGTYTIIQDNEDKSFKSFIHKFNKLNNYKRYLVNWNGRELFSVKSECYKEDKKKSKPKIKQSFTESKSKLNWDKCGFEDDMDYFEMFDTEIHYSGKDCQKDEDGYYTVCNNAQLCYHLSIFTKEVKHKIVEILLTKSNVSESSKKELRGLIKAGKL